MLATLQLSPWALPPLLAVLLLLRESLFLWPRRRERTSRALLFLVLASGAWSLLHLLAVTSPSLEVKSALERGQYVATAAVPVAWVVFCAVYADQRPLLRSRWLWPVYGVSAVTAALALLPSGFDFILAEVHGVRRESGLAGMTVVYGPWFWVQMGVRFAAIIGASVYLGGRMVRAGGGQGKRAPVVLAACLVALGPAAVHLASRTGAQWIDLSPTGVGLAAALLGWGLLRHRLLDLGPVARTLIMVELRDPILVLDGRGRIVDANRAAEDTLGLHPYDDVPLELGTLWAASRGKPDRSAKLVLEVVGAPEHDRMRTFDVTITPLGRREGSGRTALLLRDVTLRERVEAELRETTAKLTAANTELERRANTDGLTGLANRRHFMETLGRELERADRYGRPVSLLLMDLDHFKKVNDTHGHAAGDDVLRGSADALRSVCRDLDLAGRLGGEELAVLLPETDAAGALAVAERLRERIGEARFESPDGEHFQVTASIGVATATKGARTPEALLQRADEALYQAKAEGRNRVVVAA